MKIKVMYHSKGGNTKKIAEAIGQALNQPAEQVPPAYPPDNIKLLFLGSGLYAGKIDNKIRNFIDALDSKKVRNIALFGTSGGQDTAIRIMRELLQAKGINVLEESYLCEGKFFIFFKRKHPDAHDIKNAQDFALKAFEKIKNQP